MNPIIKALLVAAEHTAAMAVPGGTLADTAIHDIIEHRRATDVQILDAVQGAIEAINGIRGVEIADPIQFRAGIATMEAGMKLVRASLHPVGPVGPAQ